MRYLLLGPLQVDHDGRRVDIGPPKQRAVLAALLLARGAVVSADRLMDAVWGDDVPGSATASLQAYISNLRKALRPHDGAAAAIVRQAPGYYLVAEESDLAEFTEHGATARAAVSAGDWRGALSAADAALALWRGPLLEDLRDEHWVRAEAARVDELRTECRESRVTALLALDRTAEALAEAARLGTEEPLRERACWLHMLALYRAGRGPEALDLYSGHAKNLDDELGLQPGPELRDLQTAILRQSPELAAWPRTPAWTGASKIEAVVTPAVDLPEATAAESDPRSTLIGRERELTVMARLLADTNAGATRWLVLTGPPGIGKTRLAEEAVATVADAGGRTVWVNCPDEHGTPPWWPMRQLVRALGADADAMLQVPPDADPDSARFPVFERIHTLLRAQGPLAVVIDDAQWADPTSASCLSYIAGALRDHPVAIIVTVRDGDHGPDLRRLLATIARGDRNRHIDVPALDSGDVATLANLLAEDPADEVGDAEATILAERTGGNPFFVSEYARLPREERDAGDIPSAIKSVLDRRLAVLNPAVLQVLRVAAVVGEAMDGPAVKVLAATTRLDLDTLADYLDEAADERILVSAHGAAGYEFAHGLLREHLLATMPALRRQRLHAKVAEVLNTAVGTLDAAVSRRAQHLVEALPLVDPADVVDACRLAAQRATEQWSSETAARWWRAALDAYDLLPAAQRVDTERDALTVAMLEALARAGRGQTVFETVSRSLVDGLRAGRAATLGRVSGALLRATGGWPWLAPGADPGELLSLLERATVLAAPDPGAQTRVLAALAVGHCYYADPAVAAHELATALELADATGDPEVLADALMGHLITYSGVADKSREILGWAERLIALEHSRSPEDSLIAHSVATMAAMSLGDVVGAQRHLRAGIEGSEELRLPVLRAQLRWMEAVLAVWRGDFTEAERHHRIAAEVHERTELYGAGSGLLAMVSLRRELGLSATDLGIGVPATDLGLPDSGGDGMVALVHAIAQTIDPAPAGTAIAETAIAETLLRESAEAAAAGRAHVWTSVGQATVLAHLCADHGLTEFAAELLDELDPYRDCIAIIGQVGVVGPVALATARLQVALGDRVQAREHLAAAESLARRTGGAPSLLRCRLLACELDAEDGVDVTARAADLAHDAQRLGMRGVADAADRLR